MLKPTFNNVLKQELLERRDQFRSLGSHLEQLHFTCEEIEPITLRGYLKSLENKNSFYYSNEDYEYLALQLDVHSHLDTKSLFELLSENPELIIIAAIGFKTKNEDYHKNWKGWNLPPYILAGLTLIRERKTNSLRIQLVTHKDATDAQCQKAIECIKELKHTPPFKGSLRDISQIISSTEMPSPLAWREYIEKALVKLRDQEDILTKVVCARTKEITLDQDLSNTDIFDQINSQSSYHFCIRSGNLTFMGNTPEALLTQNDNHYEFDALAGTKARGKNEQEDLELERELMSSPKEQFEHHQVVSFITEGLHPYGEIITESSFVLKLKGLQHIKTPIKLKVKESSSDLLETLINKLHPTPAVCGLPKKAAMDFLNQEDPIERGLYAGAIGIIGLKQTQLCVAIRSLLVNNNEASQTHLTLFGGAGIVADSDVQAEWEETGNKIKSFSPISEDE